MISVCMATYNGERFIREQIDSILPQLSTEDELIISDDGSTDGTLGILAGYAAADARVKVLHHEKEISQSPYRNFRYATKNFENALRHASGDYIFLSDQDDVWLPEKVTVCMRLLEIYDCIVHNYRVIGVDGNLIEEAHFRTKPVHNQLFMNVVDNHFRGCCLALKAEILRYALPIPLNVIGHDYWIGCLAAHYGTVHYEMRPLIASRRYSDSVSAKRKRNVLEGVLYAFRHRSCLLGNILKRLWERKI